MDHPYHYRNHVHHVSSEHDRIAEHNHSRNYQSGAFAERIGVALTSYYLHHLLPHVREIFCQIGYHRAWVHHQLVCVKNR